VREALYQAEEAEKSEATHPPPKKGTFSIRHYM
jgi:hypothetical protein